MRAPFGPITSFFVANLLTGAAANLAVLAVLPHTPAMDDAAPCMICGSFGSGTPVAALAFGCGMWLRGRLTPHALQPRRWWVHALYGVGCALAVVSTLYLPEGYAGPGGTAVALICPTLAGVVALQRPGGG